MRTSTSTLINVQNRRLLKVQAHRQKPLWQDLDIWKPRSYTAIPHLPILSPNEVELLAEVLQFELLVLGLKTQTTARVVIKVHECTIVALRAWCRKHVSRVRIASCSSKMLRVRHENPTFQACTNVDKAPCLLLDSIPPFFPSAVLS